MKIRQLIPGTPVRLVRGSPETDIREPVEDSRRIAPGDLFIARSGARADGRTFIADAVRAGASAVLTDSPQGDSAGAALLVADDVPAAGAVLAERLCGEPSSRLALIGVTGTNGKTTTAHLIQQVLNQAGVRCGLIGTVQIDNGAAVREAELTTPQATLLSRTIRDMVANGCKACVMEASSHALHQRRTAGLKFRVGVFTNLTGDHLDYHKSMDEYLDAKAMLFQALPRDGWAVLNADAPPWRKLAERTAARIITCSLSDGHATCRAMVAQQTLGMTQATFAGPWGAFECALPLIGRHNVSNALQALAACHAIGLSAGKLSAGLAKCSAPPGRLQPVTTPADDFAVVVDYAHTDDALENVLRALRPVLPAGGQLRVVFGCGGDRDRTKRPRMAAVACRYADDVIITSDNPRTEDPNSIIDEIRAGLPPERLARTLCICDRAEAIAAMIDRAAAGDIVLIAGKGHENYQIIGAVKRPFDDRAVAAAALARRSTRLMQTV